MLLNPNLTENVQSALSLYELMMASLAEGSSQNDTGQTSPASGPHQTKGYSDGSEDTDLTSTLTNTTYLTNTTHGSAVPCLPQQSRSTPQSAIEDVEHDMTLRQCLNRYPKAIVWSVLFSLTLIMEGYSTILVPNLYSLDPFLQHFGTRQPNGDYEIGAAWQSALVNGALAGQIIGLFLAGWLAERTGYRKTLMIGLIAVIAFITVTFFATSKPVLLVGQCLLGVPWGIFQTISTVYASDILPVRLRGYLTT